MRQGNTPVPCDRAALFYIPRWALTLKWCLTELLAKTSCSTCQSLFTAAGEFKKPNEKASLSAIGFFRGSKVEFWRSLFLLYQADY